MLTLIRKGIRCDIKIVDGERENARLEHSMAGARKLF